MIVDNSEQTLWWILRNNFETVFSVKYEEKIRAQGRHGEQWKMEYGAFRKQMKENVMLNRLSMNLKEFPKFTIVNSDLISVGIYI